MAFGPGIGKEDTNQREPNSLSRDFPLSQVDLNVNVCLLNHCRSCSLRSKLFRASSSRKLGREQNKKGMTGEGEGKTFFLLFFAQ